MIEELAEECDKCAINEMERGIIYAQDFVEMFENVIYPKEKEYMVNIHHYDLNKAISCIVSIHKLKVKPAYHNRINIYTTGEEKCIRQLLQNKYE